MKGIRFPRGADRSKDGGIRGGHEFETKSEDGVCLGGWAAEPECGLANSKGTVILGHGFSGNSNQVRNFAEAFRNERDFCVCAIDFRNHGTSGSKSPTFGIAESWDLKAALNYASKRGYPAPYFVCGGSMGAMAAQLLSQNEQRITAAVLVHPPADAWTAISTDAWEFIKKIHPRLRKPGHAAISVASKIVSAEYGYLFDNIIDRSSCYRGTRHPDHEPAFLYIMGTNDHYGINKTRSLFNWWYPTCPAYNKGEHDIRNEDISGLFGGGPLKKIFLRQEGAHHGSEFNEDTKKIPVRFLKEQCERYAEYQGIVRKFKDGAILRSMNNGILLSSTSIAQDGLNELWRFNEVNNSGYGMILNISLNKCIDVDGWRIENGNRILLWEPHGGDNQLWKPVVCSKNTFMLINKLSKRVLDVALDDNWRLHIWDAWEGNNQQWEI